ncbi:uncharacterized protein METZ01_LOCUS368581, partial [marine metagenome]
ACAGNGGAARFGQSSADLRPVWRGGSPTGNPLRGSRPAMDSELQSARHHGGRFHGALSKSLCLL